MPSCPPVPEEQSRGQVPARVTSAISAATLAALTRVGGAALTTPAEAASSGAVINEVYGGGGNSGATLTNDFIELANAGTSAATLDGWSVQYISASGSINMSGTSGTVALVDNSTPLTCKTAADCAADSDIVDLVGYGTAVIHEGSADAPGLSNTTSAQRITTTDTDQNGTDFTTAAPTPGAPTTGGSGGGGGGTPGPLAIHDIQGTGFLSPQNGNTVTNVPGIVTGVRAVGSSKGYWIQDPSPDSNPATSEGIFVFTSSAPTVAPGDSVLVSGKV